MQEGNEILVSVVIPVYKVEKYIRKCVESVLNQTWKNLEVICVNDGTPDSSMDVVAELKDADARIEVINIENSGLSAARNKGIERASGKYICFLDSDDYLVEDAIEQLVACGEKSKSDVVFFNADPIFETKEIKKRQGSYEKYYIRRGSYPEVYSGEELFVRMMGNNDFKPSACLLFINRCFMECAKLQFYQGILHEDNLFTLQLIQKAQRAAVLEKALYKRLIREASITSGKKSVRNAYGFFICQREMNIYLEENKCSSEFSVAVQKYLDIMKKNVVNILKDMKLQDIREGICQLDPQAEKWFMKYISTEDESIQHMAEKDFKRATQKSQSNAGQCIKNYLRKCKRVVKQVRNRIITKMPGPLRWFCRTVRRYGPGYFLYRKNLKKDPQKICVSIVVPVYNVEKYLRQTLDCLMSQVLRNIEIICVDDGSTDGSEGILQEYQKRDARIKVFRQEKTGAGAARNYGMSQAVGEYLLFLDADDIFDENLCNEVYYQSMRKNADVCLFGARRLNMQSLMMEPMSWVLRIDLMPKKKIFSGQDAAEKLFQITTGCPWSKMFRRKFVLDSGLKFQNLPNTNDAYFVRTCLALADRITFVNRHFVTYRFNEGNNTQLNKAQAPTAFHEAFKAIRTELCDREIFECYEQSFCNMVLKESLFNLRTAGTKEAEEKVRDLLRKEAPAYYGLQEHPADYYYDKKTYFEMQELLEDREV